MQVHGPDRNGLERLVAQRQGRVGGIQGEVALTVEAARQQPATPRVMITTDEEPVAGAGAQIEHQARIEPRVGVSDITQADDRVVGPDEALPLGQQMVVHGSDVGKGAVEDLEGARVAEVQIGPYPGPLRGNVDHRDVNGAEAEDLEAGAAVLDEPVDVGHRGLTRGSGSHPNFGHEAHASGVSEHCPFLACAGKPVGRRLSMHLRKVHPRVRGALVGTMDDAWDVLGSSRVCGETTAC